MKYFSIFQNTAFTFESQQAGEEVLALAHRHWLFLLLPIGVTLILLALILGLLKLVYPFLTQYGLTSVGLFVLMVCIALLWLRAFYEFMLYALTSCIVTDRRIIYSYQTGLFERRVTENELTRIQDITLDIQGILATFLDFGTIRVQTAGTEGQFVIVGVPKPHELRDVISQARRGHGRK